VTLFGRFAAFVLVALLIGGLSVSVAALPAEATVTTLCKGYSACAKAGMPAAGYAAASRTMYWRMYAGHNCTNYAAYRMVRSGLDNSRPWTGSGNATNWGTAMSRITNGAPAVGAVAWWKAHVSPAGSVGHVAYVERVVSANEIIVSQDSWGGDFSWARITRASKGWPSGFVHFNDVRQLNTAVPAISGTSKVGSVLTASPGVWSPSGATFTYQWTQDGVNIVGATGPALTLTRARLAKRIAVRVTATHLGFPAASATSLRTIAVKPDVLRNTSPPTVTGDPRVDSTLSAGPGVWDPAPDEVRYQWRADGDPLEGATDSTLTVDPALASREISVTVTAVKAGYAPVAATSRTTSAVAPGILTVSTPPRLRGTPQLGRTLTLSRPRAQPQTTVTVRWLRAGVPVAGATGPTYRLTAADLGSRVAARVRLSRPGYTSLTTRTGWTRLVRSTPVIRVTTKPGRGRLALSASVSARGVHPVTGVIQIRSRGRLLAQVPLRSGKASTTLTHLPRGTRAFRFRVPTTATISGRRLVRRIRIG